MRGIFILTAVAALAAAASAQVDRLVDAAGARSPYTTIEQAMLVSSPGDRILVLPGQYPAFQFSRGVHVIGLGQDASQVVVERVAYHVSVPAIHYDTLLSNMTIRSSNPLDTLVLSGNELAPGVLVLDHVDVRGGVFLRGGEVGFYLLMYDSHVEPQPGHGFSGESCWVGGPGAYVEIHDTDIVGWNADPAAFATAGSAIRFGGGTSARVSGSRITGGDGAPFGAPYEDGATAIVWAGPGVVDLRIDGGSVVGGGDGANSGAGGDGVAVPGTIELGQATVAGGTGNPPGAPFGMAQPAPIDPDIALSVHPQRRFTQGPAAAEPGDTVSFALGTPAASSILVVSFGVDRPESDFFFALDETQATVVFGSSVSGVVPEVPGFDFPGLMIFAQGAYYDPATGLWQTSNTGAVRVDL